MIVRSYLAELDMWITVSAAAGLVAGAVANIAAGLIGIVDCRETPGRE